MRYYILDRYFAKKLLYIIKYRISGRYVCDTKIKYKHGYATLWVKKETENNKQYRIAFGCAIEDVLFYWFNINFTLDSVFQNLKEVMR